ncbi:MAG: hypothetical protein RLY31_586 [Bacteroidota bacterium]
MLDNIRRMIWFSTPCRVTLGMFTILLLSCRAELSVFPSADSDFVLEPGFSIRTVAAEPFVDTPVALAFDDRNRLWVLNMPGYMPDLAGDANTEPIGKVVILEDCDGDGVMDSRKVFLDNLVMARAMAFYADGLLLAEPPALWFVPILDDRPGKRVLVDSAYAPGHNPEYQANGLLCNPDNWVYSADCPKRYRRDGQTWRIDSVSQRGQWGLTMDSLGRLIYNSNATQLIGDQVLPGLADRSAGFPIRYAAGTVLTADQRVYPVRQTLVNRGYQHGVLDSLGKLRRFTAACAPLCYSAGQFPADFRQNVFVCAPEAHLVKRNRLLSDGETGRLFAEQAYQDREFLASRDSFFRPVFLATGPHDGCLYIADMHRGVIQHRAYMSQYLFSRTKESGLDTLIGRGRVYRVCHDPAPAGSSPTPRRAEDLVRTLADPVAARRLQAQQLLVHDLRLPVRNLLEQLVRTPDAGVAAIHALWTLEGRKELSPDIVRQALASPDPGLVWSALKLLATDHDLPAQHLSSAVLDMLQSRNDGQTDRYLLALMQSAELAADSSRFPFVADILMRHTKDTLAWEMLASAPKGLPPAFLSFLRSLPPPARDSLAPCLTWMEKVASPPPAHRTDRPAVFDHTDGRTAGMVLFRTYCEACHQADGSGRNGLAPPLVGSSVVNGDPSHLRRIIWEGKTGPVSIRGEIRSFDGEMPAFRDNPAWDSTMVAAVAEYVRNAFADNIGSTPANIKPAAAGFARPPR